MCNETNLSKFRGDSFDIFMTFRDTDDDPIDITGWTLFFTVKVAMNDTDADAVISEEVTSHLSPTGGQTKISVTAAQTSTLLGDYYYDVQYKKPDGTIKTVLKGLIGFTKDVTQRTT